MSSQSELSLDSSLLYLTMRSAMTKSLIELRDNRSHIGASLNH